MTHHDIIMDNDVARHIYCDMTMNNGIAMCTYHAMTMYNDITYKPLLCITTPNYNTNPRDISFRSLHKHCSWFYLIPFIIFRLIL